MNASKPIIPIFFSTDDNYAPYLGAAIRSLTQNASRDHLCKIYVLTTSLSGSNCRALRRCVKGCAELEFVNVQESLDRISSKLHLRDYYSKATYYRFFIAELFPQYEKAVYLDCDIIVNGDISELYNVDLGNNLLGAVRDEVVYQTPVFSEYVERVLEVSRNSYFNAGVLLLNLAEFRRRDILGSFTKLLSKRRFDVAQDQDYLNVISYGSVVKIGIEWNKPPIVDEILGSSIPKLVHFNLNRKPWNYEDVMYGDLFWHYALQTPFAERLVEGLGAYSEESRRRDQNDFYRLCRLAARQASEAELTVLCNA